MHGELKIERVDGFIQELQEELGEVPLLDAILLDIRRLRGF